MKRAIIFVLPILLLGLFVGPEMRAQENNKTTVYVTKTGTKYHKEGCRYLSTSSTAMKLSEVSSKYSPCSVCKPPQVTKKEEVAPSIRTQKKQETYSGRCQATTKKGAQCKRNAKAGSRYCWQHGG